MTHQPKTKSDYFELSAGLGLPARCPLLERCVRRAETIALANRWPLQEAPSRVSLKAPFVPVVGEGPYEIGGGNNFSTGGLCPEVNLFETTVALIGLSGQPTTRGQYDKYMEPQFEITDTGHYSQCAEYAACQHASQAPVNARPSWLLNNYQWLLGTIVAIAGTVAAFLALK
jgi:hypothetical protein